MAPTAQDRLGEGIIKIFVRKRRIMRRKVFIDGWQAGFTPDSRGGATHETRDGAIEEQAAIARRIIPDCTIEIVDIQRKGAA